MDDDLLPLPPGTPAPDFRLRHTSWSTLSLHRLAGRPIVLVFFPSAFEPVSGEQLTLYQEHLPEFEELRAQMVGISADYAWCLDAFSRQAGITFPLLADTPPRGKVSRLYSVYRESDHATARALFVIDASGIICFGRVYPELLDPGVGELFGVLESLHTHNA